MADLDAAEERFPAERQKTGPEVGSQILVERREQNGLVPARRELFDQVLHPVQSHDGLAGAGAASDACGTVVVAVHELGLGGVEEDLPTTEVLALQSLAERLVGCRDDGRGALDGGLEVIGVDRLGRGDRRGDLFEDFVERFLVVEREQDLTGQLRRVVDEPQQLVLGGERLNDRDQRPGYTEVRELLLGPGNEQRHVRRGGRLPG